MRNGATFIRVPDRVGQRLMLGGENEGLGAAALARGDIGHPAARRDRTILGQQSAAVIVAGEFIAMLDEQPIVLLVARLAVLDPYQNPFAMQPFAFDRE